MEKKKNVLLLFSDQHRGDWLPGLQGKEFLNMPNIKSLRDGGITFTNCVTPSPLCAPARACLAMGDDYDHCGTYNNKYCMPVDRATVYSLVKACGYKVGNSGKLDLHKPCLYWGEDGWLPQLGEIGFTDAVDSEGKWDTLWASYEEAHGPYGAYLRCHHMMEEYARDYTKRFFDPMITEPTHISDASYADNYVTDTALKLLSDFYKSDKPWFITVNFSGPHDPWDITEEMWESVQGETLPLPQSYTGDREKLLHVRQNYHAMLENIDGNIGLLIESLKQSGQYEDTLIIYSADHGEMLGDRNQYYKSKPYNASIRIPLILVGNGIRKGCDENTPIQLQDIAATIAEWCGTALPEERDGKSLLGIATGLNTKPVRTCQISKLSKSVDDARSFAGYERYAAYKKVKSDRDFFGKICKDLSISWKEIPEVHKEEIPDWACVIADGYKLIIYSNGGKELYRIDDEEEQRDLSKMLPEKVEYMLDQYGLTLYR